MSGKGANVSTNGCMVLRHRTKRLTAVLDEIVENDSSISFEDVSIISGCAVISATEDESIELIHEALNATPKPKRVLITGCLPKINESRVKAEFGDKVLVVSELEDVPSALGNNVDSRLFHEIQVSDDAEDQSKGDPLIAYGHLEDDVHSGFRMLGQIFNDEFIEDFYRYQTKGKHFWKEPGIREILVTEGCNYKCGFCATKLAIGNTKSRDIDLVFRELQQAKLDGIPKIVLQGDEIGNYLHKGVDLGGVVSKFREMSGHESSSLALRYVHPSPLIKAGDWLERSFEDGTCYFVCCALQTGNQSVSDAMKRPFSVEKAVERLMKLRSSAKRGFIHTQLIAGYPGETRAQFEDTLKMVEDTEFDYISYAKFDARPGTLAAKLPDQIHSDEADERLERLSEAVENVRIKRLRRHALSIVSKPGLGINVSSGADALKVVASIGRGETRVRAIALA